MPAVHQPRQAAARRRRSGRWARALAAVLALGAPALGPTWAAGQPAPPPGGDPPAVNSWALAPGGSTPGQPNSPGSRPNLSYELAPGATVSDTVALFNYGNVQLTFAVYATDAFNNQAGNFDLLAGDKHPTDLGSWVKLPQANVTVPARTRLDLPFSLIVPPNALPGDHAAAILASSTVGGRDSQGRVVNVDRRAGSRLYVRVGGPLEPRLAVEKVRTVYHGSLNPLKGSADVSYTVRNVGNVRLPAHQRLAVKGPFGWTLDRRRPADLPELLPGNSITVKAHFVDVPAVFRVGTTVSVTGFTTVGGPDARQPAAVARTGSTWAIPWTVIVTVALLILLRALYRRRRRARAGPAPVGPDASTTAPPRDPTAETGPAGETTEDHARNAR